MGSQIFWKLPYDIGYEWHALEPGSPLTGAEKGFLALSGHGGV